jgi:MFS family permease
VVGFASVTGLREKLVEATTSLREVFRNPGLRRIQLAFAGSIVGDWAYNTAVAVYAYEQGGPTAVGLLSVVKYACVTVVTPFASVLGDRYPRRLVMVGSDTIRAVLVAAAALLVAGGASPYAVYALAVAVFVAQAPFRPTQSSFLPDLARTPGELASANVASSTVESVGFFAGPALAGFMLAVASIPTVFVFNAATFVWSALLVLGIRPPAKPKEHGAESPDAVEAAKPSFLAETSAGFREIVRNRDLRIMATLYCGQTVVAGASTVFQVSIALSLLDIGRSGVGYLSATLGIGGLVGGFVALVLVQRGRLARDFGVGVVLWSAPLLLVAAWPTIATAAFAMLLLGFGNSIVDINADTILQRIARPETMSRVFGALYSGLMAGMGLGALVMPLLIRTVGLRWGLVFVGAAVSSLLFFGAAGLRRIDTIALAPPGLELLRGVPLLGFLPEPTLNALARALVRVEVTAGETFIREGEPGDLFYVLESGAVEVTKEGRHVANLGPGDYVGEIALLHDVPRTASVRATADAVLQALDRETFIPAVTGQGAFREAADVAIATRLAML